MAFVRTYLQKGQQNQLQKSQEFQFSLNANELELLSGPISVVKKQLFTRLDVPFCKNPNAMVSIHHHHFGVAVWVNGMVGKSNLIAFTSGIHNEIIVQVEEKAAHVLVIHLSSTISFIL